MRRNKQMGLTHLGDRPPRPIAGVEQRCIVVDPARPFDAQLPDRCDKCGNPRLTVNGREIACRSVRGGCGKTWFLVAGAPIEMRHFSERTIARHRANDRARVA